MLTATPLQQQLDAQRDDRLRVVIAGAGVAGLTLAAMLRTQGLHPVLIERMPQMEHPGYMLALMPIVDAALQDIGAHDAYLASSTPLARYAFRSHRGKTLRSDDLGALLEVHGDYQGIDRGALIDVLTADGCPVSFDTTVAAFDDGRATFSTGEQASFDLLVAADGIHSRTRDLLDVGDVASLETGWSGWVTWSNVLGDDPTLGEELWGDGFFLGVYPVKDRLGVFLGGPAGDLSVGAAAFAAHARQAAPEIGPRLQAALDAVAADPDPTCGRSRTSAPTGGSAAVLCSSATQHPDSCPPPESGRAWRSSRPGCWDGCSRMPTARTSTHCSPNGSACRSRAWSRRSRTRGCWRS